MAFALVQKTVAQSSDTNGVTSSAINTSGADLLVLCASWYSGGGTANVTISDSKGNTWTALTKYDNTADGNNQNCRIFYAKNATVGSGHTFTAAGSATYAAISVSAWSGSDLTAPFDVENGAHASGVVTVQTGSVTPSVDNELIITVEGNTLAAGGTMTINLSFTLLDSVDRVTNGLAVAAAYLIETTATAKNPTWTAPNSITPVAAIATFKAGAGSDTAINPGVGTLTFTGYAPAVSQSGAQSVSPGVGSMTITGYAPTVARTTNVTLTTPVIKNNTGTVLSNETGAAINIYNSTTGALVLRKTSQTTDSSGIMTVTDGTSTLVSGTTYAYEVVLATAGRRLPVATTT